MARLAWSSASQANEPIPASRTTIPAPVNAPPVVALTSPANGASFLAGDTIPLAATASDPDGYIGRVEFWANGVKLGEAASPPYSLSWTGPHGAGFYALTARALDAAGVTATTPAASVQAMEFRLTPAQVQRLTDPDRVVSTLHFTIPAGRNYVVEWSADLVSWNSLGTGTSGGAQIEVTDTATQVDRRFYRVRIF